MALLQECNKSIERKYGMRANKLKGKIIEKGLSIEKVAEMIGINKATFYRKLSHFDKFTVGDVLAIKKVLSLTPEEVCLIFID